MILLQKRHELLLKRPLLVMLLLPRDIFRYLRNARFTDAENAITRLPRKSGRMVLPHPTSRIRFHNTRDLGRRMRRSHANQHVDVIRFAVDDQRGPVHHADNPAEVGEKIIAEFGFDQRSPPVGREDEMQQNIP